MPSPTVWDTALELKVSLTAKNSIFLLTPFGTMLTAVIAHESPYLNKWNTGILLQPGMTFTNEPGIYLEGRFGVRHEDIYLVKEDGEAELLTGQRARGPFEP